MVRRGLTVDHPNVTERPSSEARDLRAEGFGGREEESDDENNHQNGSQDPLEGGSTAHPNFNSQSTSRIMSGAKRGATETAEGGPPAKVGSGAAADSSSSSLPGTGHGEDPLRPGGDHMVAPGPIERPFGGMNIKIMNYRKVHRFLTFGLAYRPVSFSRGTSPNTFNEVFMVTPLAEIPWDRLFLYMNPSEYAILPSGSEVIECHVKVRQRNVRVAFQTNATTTEVATLNQNKNAVYGFGLRQNHRGVNVLPSTFDANQPMVVTALDSTTSVGKGAYTDYDVDVNNLYGVPNNDAGFTTGTPRHQWGIPYILKRYYAGVNRSNEPYNSGWPCFQNYIEEMDADSTSGCIFVEKTYKPVNGIIKNTFQSIDTAFPNGDVTALANRNIREGIGMPRASRTLQVNVSAGEIESVQRQTNQSSLMAADAGTTIIPGTPRAAITQFIEKSQVFCRGGRDPDDRISSQPSLHVGVQPVPALTTSTFNSTAADNSFTDTQCYWEVIATCKVKVILPTERPLANIPNVPADDITYSAVDPTGGTLTTLNPRNSMYFGLYQS